MTDDNSTQQRDNRSLTTRIVVAIVAVIVIVLALWWLIPTQETSESQRQPVATEPAMQPAEEQSVATQPKSEPEPAETVVASEPEPVESEPVSSDTESSVNTAEQQTATESEPKPEPKPELPELANSTPTVLQTLDSSGIEIQPLKSSQLVTDTVVIVDNLRNGSLVRDRTIVQRPDGRFKVLEIDGSLYIDEQSYRRYDALVDWFVSLDEEALVENYKLFKPLLAEAYANIGYPDAEFRGAMIEAINVLLDTPVPETLVEVNDDEVMYTFAKPSYENLPSAQKQLLRMGPDNIKRLKGKLTSLKQEFQQPL